MSFLLGEGERGLTGLARTQEHHGRKLIKKLGQTLLR